MRKWKRGRGGGRWRERKGTGGVAAATFGGAIASKRFDRLHFRNYQYIASDKQLMRRRRRREKKNEEREKKGRGKRYGRSTGLG